MVKWIRVARTHQAPASAAAAVAVITPRSRYASRDRRWATLKRKAPAYAPRPKYAACPRERSPVVPYTRLSPRQAMPRTRA
jgi:hypothetical protein